MYMKYLRISIRSVFIVCLILFCFVLFFSSLWMFLTFFFPLKILCLAQQSCSEESIAFETISSFLFYLQIIIQDGIFPNNISYLKISPMWKYIKLYFILPLTATGVIIFHYIGLNMKLKKKSIARENIFFSWDSIILLRNHNAYQFKDNWNKWVVYDYAGIVETKLFSVLCVMSQLSPEMRKKWEQKKVLSFCVCTC